MVIRRFLKKPYGATGFATAITIAALFLVSACSAKPPQVNQREAVDFWVLPAAGPANMYRPSGSLDSLVQAYNRVSTATFNSDTTPTLEAFLELADGTVMTFMFSPSFPQDHAVILIQPASRQASLPPGSQGQSYEVRAPGLLRAVWDLARGGLDADALEPQSDWLPED